VLMRAKSSFLIDLMSKHGNYRSSSIFLSRNRENI
jgi:hypothetical protein